MRILEVTLILFAFIYLIQLILNRSLIPTKRMMILLSILLIAHILVDAMRWQMIPVYLVVLVSLIGEYADKTLQHRWTRAIVFSSGIVGVILSSFLCSVLPIFKLPPVSGGHTIATEVISLPYGNTQREVKLWFPIQHTEKKLARYHPHPARSLKGIMGVPGFVLSHLKLVKSNAYAVTQYPSDTISYPLVLYSHGAMSTLIDNTALLEDIASHGYVVAAIDHDFSFDKYGMDEESASIIQVGAQTKLIDDLIKYVVPQQAKDYQVTLTNLLSSRSEYNIDTSSIVLLGHSLGGTTAFKGSTQLDYITAAINIDGPVDTVGMVDNTTALLYISSFSPNLPDAELTKRGVPPAFYRGVKSYELGPVKTLFAIPNQDRAWVRLRQASHLDFTDVPFIMPLMASKRYNKYSGHSARADIVVNFLDTHTKGKAPAVRKEQKPIEWLY